MTYSEFAAIDKCSCLKVGLTLFVDIELETK
jgi:hypothetical protein